MYIAIQRNMISIPQLNAIKYNEVLYLGFSISNTFWEISLWPWTSSKPGENRNGQLDQARLTRWVGAWVAKL